MKKISVLAILLASVLWIGLGSTGAASAALPFEVEVIDFDIDSDIDGDDIQAAIATCSPASYFGGGCTLLLPRDVITLTSTLVLGGGSAYPVGLIFRGQGSCSRATNPPGHSAGTVLRWDGPDQGTMIELQRAQRLRFEHLCLVLDPDLTPGGPAARYGFLFNGDVSQGHITQGTVFQNVGIYGPVGTPPDGMTGVYITGTGTPKSAQNDKMQFEDCYVRGVDIGIHQDALQALMNVYEGGELFGHSHALKVSAGNVDLRDTIVGCTKLDCAVLHLAYQQFAGHQETLFSNLYWETGSPATFLKVADGWSPANANPGNNTPIEVENSYMTNQRNGGPGTCDQLLLDAATRAPVIFRGNHLFTTGDFEFDCGFHLQVSNPELDDFNVIHWSENQVRTRMPADFLSITLTGANLDILALTLDPATGHTFNDKNLNRIRDVDEEPMERGTASDAYGPALWAAPGTSGDEACTSLGLACSTASEIEGFATTVGCAESAQKRVVFCK